MDPCRILSIIVMALILIPCLPWIIFWEIAIVVTVFWDMRKYKGKLSFTAVMPLGFRQFCHFFGVRHDPAAQALFRKLPHAPFIPLLMMQLPVKLAVIVSRYKISLGENPVVARTRFFDDELRTWLTADDNEKQFVVLGAGFDTRAYTLHIPAKIQVFEVDKPYTQQIKTKALDDSRISRSHVRYVPCDFETQQWDECLTNAEFDPSKDTFFLLEGVSYYLKPATFAGILATVAGFPGHCQISFDYYLPHKVAAMQRGTMGRFTRGAGEDIILAMTDAEVVEVVKSAGLNVANHETGKDAGLVTGQA
eukprot:TRINITY_DN94281_c0_g1_i1.p1 TRINITY_DN94281_c0_g1~~TRINITY_DN94281_c0_g1_i1.p1  ORF type:complete len:316 (+),score=10.74 TRINITY_DN94281_c0_g1_i1:29-949(+)